MMATSTKLPLTISGGCLCGSIRYEIAFPEDHQWPPKVSSCASHHSRQFLRGTHGNHALIRQLYFFKPPLIDSPLPSHRHANVPCVANGLVPWLLSSL